MQRYAQSSQFKRTVLEFMAAEMLESQVAGHPGDAPAGVCRITAGATPVVTSPTDSSMEYLYAQLGLAEADVADRHAISDGLQRLGENDRAHDCRLAWSCISWRDAYRGMHTRDCLRYNCSMHMRIQGATA
jgi:hypothetical protein